MKWMIVAGGTAGHINPALALAKVARKNNPDLEIVFMGSKDRLEAKMIPVANFPFIPLHISSTSGNIVHKIKGLASVFLSIPKCKKILKKEKPDICLGFGNYISVPVLMAAHQLGIPIFLHEQNSFPGKANLFLAKKATMIATCFEENQFPKEKTRLLGNPQASLLKDFQVNKKKAFEAFGLKESLPLVTIMLGSLGSSSVSKIIDEAISFFHDGYQVLISTGQSNDYVYKHLSSERVKIVPYFDGKTYLSLSDLAITRAGATTLSELEALAIPSLLIPSPYVPNNHQEINAMRLVHQGAAVLLREPELTAEKLAKQINQCMEDKQLLKNLKDKALLGQTKDSAEEIIAWIKEVTHDRH
ncbi:glycosyltransferase [Bulleidia sp. zg-1006]|uniref:UDP-N-acetylglucosamine--N-acetylmuramyl- (pentapeptide) pyrophosphoryl-undecaprenol N-acetylglucosamine transferase n=1 Tax=Bulleidia sp. zg-1006 TaxID=2806552 RepID=UPI00193A6C49|nr:UDP-N-acetylglucosamine--N-acetylmuramyl-(pentapeptide) pyrophosphoryl-undecaprenol N-acetylglucosamine transferase [Bulleidia sp. zg-1006]QRG87405.1 UDP-N-acetylglucosamine--N-acetylmuramyl-(pentapeptide) pyrophosphoryl-undecaprenol N-acetylglucosamine transferase [Bulleidia sp. zg-1006]